MVLANGKFMTTKYSVPCTALASGEKKPKTQHGQLLYTRVPPLQHKLGMLNRKASCPRPILSSVTAACHASLQSFLLQSALWLTSTYNNRSLPRMSPSHVCNNRLHPMQTTICTNILSPTVAQRWPSLDLFLLLWLIYSSPIYFRVLISSSLLFPHCYSFTFTH